MNGKPHLRTVLGRWARRLAPVLVLPLLASCVTYYYPAQQQDDGVYYAADDPGQASVGYGDYAAVSYYPWWSVDYFYLGYGYRGSSVSVGFSYGYPAWPSHSWAWYPYYHTPVYYDPWYASWWYRPVHYPWSWYGYPGYNAYWHVHYRHYRDYAHDRGHGGRHRGDHGRGDEEWRSGEYGPGRYAGDTRRDPYAEPGADDFAAARSRSRNEPGGSWRGSGGQQRRVSVAPGPDGDRGLVVSSADGGKWSRSRTEPVGSAQPVRRDGAPTVAAPSFRDDSRRVPDRGPATVGRLPGAKSHGPRTTPVGEPVRAGAIPSNPAAGAYRVNPAQPSAQVGAPSGRKAQPLRTQPVSPPVPVTRSQLPAAGRAPSTGNYSKPGGATSRSSPTKSRPAAAPAPRPRPAEKPAKSGSGSERDR